MKHIIPIASAIALASTAGVAFAQAPLPGFQAGTLPETRFPDPDRATLKRGTFTDPSKIARVAPGLSKDQVYDLLDVPHFHEGLFGVRTWNYIFNFYTGVGSAYQSCQFQIHYDAKVRVDGAWWKDGECARFLVAPAGTQPIVLAAPALPPPPHVAQKVEGQAERDFVVYFPFDEATIELNAQDVLTQAAAYAKRGAVSRVSIIGHTDTSGGGDYNMQLSERRAKVVADALVQLGVPQSAISLEWKGKTDLAVSTPDGVKEPFNRRSTVRIRF